MANVDGIFGITEVRLLAEADAIVEVKLIDTGNGWNVMIGIRAQERGEFARWKCMTKAQSMEVRTFRTLDAAYRTVRTFWADRVEVIR